MQQEQRDRQPNPYIGPRPFAREDTLYGRVQETSDLYYLLAAERVVLMYSPSGAGKTSLIQAGLIPRLEEEGYDVLPVIRAGAPLTLEGNTLPANRYLANVLRFLAENEEQVVQRIAAMTTAQEMATDIETLLAQRKQTNRRQVLIFDQFEEVLTQDKTDQRAKREFFEQLGALIDRASLWVLFGMREEYIAALDPYLHLVPTQFRVTFRLQLLTIDPALQAILQPPLKRYGVTYENRVLSSLLDTLRLVREYGPDGKPREKPGPFIEPLMLQVVCYSLWEKWAAGRQVEPQTTIRLDDYERLAGKDATDTPRSLVDKALESYYAEKVEAVAADATVNVAERDIRDWIEKQMIVGDMRRLVTQGDVPKDMRAALDGLKEAYLVRQESHWSGWFELTHDRLVEPVRQNNAAWREKNLSLLQRQATLWEQENRAEGLLLQDRALREAEQWAEEHKEEVTDRERAFLEAARSKQRGRTRFRRVSYLALFLAIAALAMMFWALNAAAEAESRARANEIAFEAQSTRDEDPELSLLLAIEATKIEQSPLIKNVLQQTIQSSRVRVRLEGHTEAVISAAFSKNGAYIVTASLDHTARIWDATTGETLRVLRHDDDVLDATFSDDGQYVVTASKDDTARVWNATTGEELIPLNGHEGDVYSSVFSPDGLHILTASHDGTARIWNAETGEEQRILSRGDKALWSAAYSPDGQRIVTGSDNWNACVWDARTGAAFWVIPVPEKWVRRAAFSPDGQDVVTAGGDATARIWNSTTQEQRIALRGHTDWATDTMFSPDGRRVVTASKDGTARIWDVENEEVLLTLRGHKGIVFRVAFSPDGQQVVSAGGDGTARIWDVRTSVEDLPEGFEDLLSLAKRRVTRNLTQGERKVYLEKTVER